MLGAIALAVPFIAGFEAFGAAPYLCPAGRWTIGFGTTVYPNGVPVGRNDAPIDHAKAHDFLRSALIQLDQAIKPHLIKTPLTNQYAAMLSLAYNIGSGNFASSTLLAKFNAGDVAGTANEFLEWDKARINGTLVALAGLTKRRQAERALFLKDQP